jgi:hypothetical protein
MINREELRIGNLVKFHGLFGMVNAIGRHYCFLLNADNEEYKVEYKDMWPIRLEEQMICDMGFKMHWNELYDMPHFTFGIITLRVYVDDYIDVKLEREKTGRLDQALEPYWKIKEREYEYIRYFTYVHEIQNLVYSIYGDELKLKNPLW